MKFIHENQLSQLKGIQLEKDDTFSFKCHPEIACFNQCCRNLNLFLYPYDVVRLKNRLKISSDEFIEQYVDIVLRNSDSFPEVLLRMADNEEKTCPFLDKSGCLVYPDRPDTCRTFPIEHGAIFDDQTHQKRMVYLYRPPAFCLGQNETQQWTPETWIKDQQAEFYHEMTAQWANIRARLINTPWQNEGPQGPRTKMTFMAAYNIDRFRDFLFSSSFFKRYKVKPKLQNKLKTNDTELLLFAFDWIHFYLWNKPSRLFSVIR